MKTFLAVVALASLFLATKGGTPITPQQTNKKAPICIIGAGASGLSAAIRLRSKGYTNILIFERRSIAGGKAYDHIGPDGLTYPMGAVFATKNHVLVKDLLKTYGVGTYFDNIYTFVFNPNNGYISLFSSVFRPGFLKQDLDAAVARYTDLRQQYSLYLVPGFIYGVPTELLMSTYDWIKKNNLDVLFPALYFYGTTFGYGSMKKLPVIYTLFAFDAESLSSAFGVSNRILTDFALLWKRVSWGFNIKYNVDISKVDRSEGTSKPATIYYTQRDDNGRTITKNLVQQSCRTVIAAIPTTLEKLSFMNLDAKESAVFSRAMHINYYTALVNMPKSDVGVYIGLLDDNLQLIEPAGDSRPMLYTFWEWQAKSTVATYYAYQDGAALPLDKFKQIGLQTMSLLDYSTFPYPFLGGPPFPSTPVTNQDYGIALYWYYFPYFNTDTITPTIFAELEALQGYRNTFWLSSLRSFENTESVVASAYDIVDRYF